MTHGFQEVNSRPYTLLCNSTLQPTLQLIQDQFYKLNQRCSTGRPLTHVPLWAIPDSQFKGPRFEPHCTPGFFAQNLLPTQREILFSKNVGKDLATLKIQDM